MSMSAVITPGKYYLTAHTTRKTLLYRFFSDPDLEALCGHRLITHHNPESAALSEFV